MEERPFIRVECGGRWLFQCQANTVTEFLDPKVTDHVTKQKVELALDCRHNRSARYSVEMG